MNYRKELSYVFNDAKTEASFLFNSSNNVYEDTLDTLKTKITDRVIAPMLSELSDKEVVINNLTGRVTALQADNLRLTTQLAELKKPTEGGNTNG